MANAEHTATNVRNLAEAAGCDIYAGGYSGRGMFGQKCMGIKCDDPADVLELIREYGLPRPTQDQLGKGYICYWPNIASD